MASKYRRAGCVFLAWVMTASLGASAALALANGDGSVKATADTGILDTVSFEDVTGKIDLTSVALQNLSPSVLENAGFVTQDENRTVIVTLEGDCIVDGTTGGQTVAEYLSTYAGSKKLRNIQTEQTNFLTSLASLGVSYKVKYQYTTATNAVAIEVNTSHLSAIKSIASVKSAVVSETYAFPEETVDTTAPDGTSNPSNIYSTGIYDSSKYVGEGYDGSGMTVAILDTGLDYTHEAFSSMPTGTLGLTKTQLSKKLSEENIQAVSLSAANGKTITADDLYVNDKVPFAYDYADKDTDVYPSYSQHGVHVAGIVAGHASSYKNKDGVTEYEKDANGEYVLDDDGEKIPVEFNGVAPNAQLVICKVFTDNLESKSLGGAESEDILAALDDCVALGVDVINMSLGTTAGFSTKYIEGDDEGAEFIRVYGNIKKVGISLICAASNDYSSGYGSAFGTNLASNPDSGTIGSPSTFTGALSVASINGQYSPFMYANGETVVYYTDASDENGVRYNFAEQMLEGAQSKTFKYVIVGNAGQASGYNTTVRNAIAAAKAAGEKLIVLIQRGTNTFKDKVKIAQDMGASAVIIYNNVAGSIGISVGDIDDPIPTASIGMDAGNALCAAAGGLTGGMGTIEINTAYQAGPFMNDYSSWGTTPDLKIKPEITSHGGEITSAVSGGWAEMSGTSMASPNMAGFVTLLRGYLKERFPDYNNVELTRLVNQIVMSTAVTVYDQEGLPYSPRKQGAGLGTLDNVFSTNAYLYTKDKDSEEEAGDPYGAEDNRPKIELGDDKNRTGVYDDMIFYVNNFGSATLTFKADTIFMTETLSSDGLSVAEKAHLLTDIPAEWTIDGQPLAADGIITVAAGQTVKIKVKLTLSDAEKKYIDDNFVNGMFVEGFLRLISQDTTKQCSLSLPFMGFYGDWTDAPMLDYDAFQIAQFKQDSSYTDETRPKEQVWATQAYATYYHNEKYTVPMGGYAYLQDEFADQIYANEEYCAVSCYDIYGGEDSLNNYMTTTSVKALYTGLLRNAELVTYDLYNSETGELIYAGRDYRISKAYASGGSSVPANVELKLYPDELGLVNNGKYEIKFHFYFYAEDINNPAKQEANTYSMSFYVDYEAPILQEARLRYFDYKENNKDKQKVYLDLDIYDNHYAQAVVLCYTDTEGDTTMLRLATEYVTPVYNPVKNGTTTVSIEVTDIYKTYQNKLYCQIDDYALNHSVYRLAFSSSMSSAMGGMYDTFNPNLPDTFEVDGPTDITIGVNETYKFALSYEGTANLSNFTWEVSPAYVAKISNGEVFGSSVGTATVTVTANNGVNVTQRKITVHVVESSTVLGWPSISFGLIKNSANNLVKASGIVSVNAGEDISLEVMADPWYYPVEKLKLVWSSDDPEIATVDEFGNVTVNEKKGTVLIKATIMNGTTATSYSANVTLNVLDPCTISSNTLTAYHGRGGDNGVLKLPDNKNIMYIGEEAFKDNDNVRVIIIPKTVVQIADKAFLNCTALEEVYFIDTEQQPIPDSALTLIGKYAFSGCTSLKKIDFTNVKKLTLGMGVFSSEALFLSDDEEVRYRYDACTSLEEVVGMNKIGTMNSFAFAGCTSLLEADLTGTFDSGIGVFYGCTSLKTIKTDYYSSIGEDMFYGCTGLESVTINAASVSDYAFTNCSALKNVQFGGSGASSLLTVFTIGEGAFYNCRNLQTVTFGDGYKVSTVGSLAFANCEALSDINIPEGAAYGIRVFENTQIESIDDIYLGAYYSGTILVSAPQNITSTFEIREGTTEIAAYAFSGCRFATGVTLVIPDTVTKIGERAFSNSNLSSVVLPAGLTEIPAYAFAMTSLSSIEIPATVTMIGEGAFFNCRALSGVSFGTRTGSLALGDGVFYGCSSIEEISLPALTGNTVASLTFFNCSSLESVNLGSATVIGAQAFANCASLGTVTGLDKVTDIGDGAFEGCSALTALNLAAARTIGARAFYMENGGHYTTLSIPVAVTIGNNAFYGGAESTVNLPASLVSLGYGAFANSKNLTAINASGDKFFTENGAVYRIISGNNQNGAYELSAYPSSRVVTGAEKVYNVKEGTVTVLAEAFRGLTSGAITEIVLPYSVTSIGDGAFYDSGITSFVFNSIAAPVLLSDYYESDFIFYSLYYTNFEHGLQSILDGTAVSELKISYPTNGTGYDNYVYTRYFKTVTLLGELMDDATRELKEILEGFASASEVAGWVNLENNTENYNMVNSFSESVKAAHLAYTQITGETQLGFLGEENVQKLFDIEEALKAVKTHFNIPVRVASVALSPDSTHKTQYVVGERFDMTGLQLIVTYDDYSTALADMSKVSIASGYDRELASYDNQVVLTYEGRSVYIQISVSDEAEPVTPPAEDQPKKKSGCGATSMISGGGISGFVALGLTACAFAALVVFKRKKV